MAQISELHIEDFCKDSAKIFIALYQSFPQNITLYAEDICGPDTPDEFGLHSPRFAACFSAMLWLAKAGLIQYTDTVKQEALEQVTLTHKAFTFLASINTQLPSSQMPANATHISFLHYALTNKTSTYLQELVLSYLKEVQKY